jgi:hypothetical protein
MKHAVIGLCLFAAACSSQPFSPTAPTGGANAQANANGGAPVEVTFTKWITAFPAMAGVTGGDVPGTFAGTVLGYDPFDNGTIVQLEARYEVTSGVSGHSFVAHIEGKQNNTTRHAVLNGSVISGWQIGAQVQVTFDVIVPPAGTSCVPQAPVNTTCFQGTIRVMPGAAS